MSMTNVPLFNKIRVFVTPGFIIEVSYNGSTLVFDTKGLGSIPYPSTVARVFALLNVDGWRNGRR